jgi:glutathione peroxidase
MKLKVLFLPLITLFSCTGADAQKPTSPGDEISFYTLSVEDINGKPMSMDQFKGKYVLAVNVASKCGYTKQYKPLQELYEKYGDKLVIIGFPSNQFMNQEPGSEADIVEFCEKNYGVTFPMTSKIDVKGSDQHPVYQWLTDKNLNGVSTEKVGWNFNKFLISPEGKWLAYFGSGVEPLDEKITSLIK